MDGDMCISMRMDSKGLTRYLRAERKGHVRKAVEAMPENVVKMVARSAGVDDSSADPLLLEEIAKMCVMAKMANPRCSRCGNAQVRLRKCTGCYFTYYCGKDCQRADWDLHRGVCGKHKK